ncbi:MAG: hypothetical protein AAFX39_09760 [Pseudomonadota bacterium]
MAQATTLQAQRTDQTVASALLPSGYREVSRRHVAVDGVPAVLIRNERADGRNAGLGGEHMSWLYDDRGQLKGFVRMQQSLAAGALPAKQVAQDTALAFLKRAAPDLLENLELHWVARHDEEITITDGAEKVTTTIAGMKVKMRNSADGRWFWVIIGTDGAPMVFERDIVWVTMPGHRQTEKWLHDSWLALQATQ